MGEKHVKKKRGKKKVRVETLLGIGLSVAAAAVAAELSRCSFSQKQRRWILDRDDHKCQAPFPHREDTTHPLQVHHVLPQGYCAKVGIENPDFPENGITLCRNAHEIIHPDVPGARYTYEQDHDSFGKLKEKRRELLDHHLPYWETKFDRLMSAVAVRRTQVHQKLEEFPPKKNGTTEKRKGRLETVHSTT